jgi:hypothetical protein
MHNQRELTQPGPLLKRDGSLASAGWSRQPLLDCNLENAGFYSLRFLQSLRIKQWDYYGITTPTHFFSFTVADIGYLGMVFAYIVDFEACDFYEETLALPLARGVMLARNSQQGESYYANVNTSLRFQTEPEARVLKVDWPVFGGEPLKADVRLALPPDHESMTIVIPIENKRFYYNRKVNCMPASGVIEAGGLRFDLDPATCLGNLDWGRGVWAYKSFWVWASASGYLSDGRSLGLNLGYGFGDTSQATENAIILAGKVHKLDVVDFKYSSADFMQPWQMSSPDGRLELVFTPFVERVAETNVLLLTSKVHQMFGRYNGYIISDNGEKIQVENLVGWAEEHHAKW